MLKIKPGQTWRVRAGYDVSVSRIDTDGEMPVHTYSRFDDYTRCSLEGRARADGRDCPEDLVELIKDVP